MSSPIERQRYMSNPYTDTVETEENWLVKADEGLLPEYQFEELQVLPNQLHYAAIDGNIPYMKHLIDKGWDIEKRQGNDFTALHEACAANKLDAVKILIAAGADLHARENQTSGMTPLHLAAGNGFTKVGLALLEAGADPLLRIDNGAVPGKFNQDGATCIAYVEAASDHKLVSAMHMVVANREAKELQEATPKISILGPKEALSRLSGNPQQEVAPRARRL